ncbi:MAG: hypothetical protein HN952_06210 [Candidatus Cloacimonetes bacterium]|jgi:hypothetical protein|nr:hypothetical protein [Candidatus Cloacimonadota bacterium]MBT7470202.1 hypothetical protein [Candidatus Cloacimonadota bacterium]
MANERYGNNYLTCLGKEASYGTEQTTYEVILPDKVEMKKTIASIDISQKTGTLEKKNTEMHAGYTGGTVAISGELKTGADANTHHGILLEAMFNDSASVFNIPAVGTTPNSYTIYQYFNDDAGHKAVGCVLESLEIAGSSGGAITYTANFRAKTITYETDLSALTDPFSSVPAITPALFANTTVQLIGDDTNISKINSFTLSLTNSFADEANMYQNSNTKLLEILTGFAGSLSVEWNYDKTNNSDVEAKLMTTASDAITITDGTNSWILSTFGKYTEYQFSDPDKGIFTSRLSKTLMSDASNDAVAITIT